MSDTIKALIEADKIRQHKLKAALEELDQFKKKPDGYTRYNPSTHISGKAYSLSQENMGLMLDEIGRLKETLGWRQAEIKVLKEELQVKRTPLPFLNSHFVRKDVVASQLSSLRSQLTKCREALNEISAGIEVKVMNDIAIEVLAEIEEQDGL